MIEYPALKEQIILTEHNWVSPCEWNVYQLQRSSSRLSVIALRARFHWSARNTRMRNSSSKKQVPWFGGLHVPRILIYIEWVTRFKHTKITGKGTISISLLVVFIVISLYKTKNSWNIIYWTTLAILFANSFQRWNVCFVTSMVGW